MPRLPHCAAFRGVAVALLLLAVCTGCRRERPATESPADPTPQTAATPGELEAVPRPDVSAADVRVREQLEEHWHEVDERLAAPDPDPEASAEAFGGLGMTYVAYDFLESAAACFANARRLAPQDHRWPYLAGYVARLEGRLEDARRDLQRALELEPRLHAARLRLGRLELELGNHDAARLQFQRALAHDPRSAPALEGMGRLAAADGDHRAAIDSFEKALEAQPDATALEYALAQSWRRLGDTERAQRHLDRRGDVGTTIADPLITPLATAGRSAQFYLIQGGEALADGAYEVAVVAYEHALEQDPHNFRAYKGLSYSLDKLGNVEGAIAQLRLAVAEGKEDDPADDRRLRADSYQALGSLLVLTGRGNEAIDAFRRSLELEPGKAGVRLKLANALARGGELQQAVTEYDRVLKENPSAAPEVLVKRAMALVNLGRREEALADFRRAIAASPDDATIRLRHAEALEFLGESERAGEERAAASRLAGGGGDRIELLVKTARQQVASGRHAEAAESLEEAVRLAPDRNDVRYQLAAVLAHLGRYEEALPEFRRVVEEAPRHAAAHRGEIIALLFAGRYGEARVRLNETMRHFPLDAEMAHLQARLLASSPDPRVRDGDLALEVSRRLTAVRRDLPMRETLAMAHAAAGEFDEAVALQEQLLTEVERAGDTDAAGLLRARLAAYRRHEAWSAASPQEIVAAALGGP